MVRRRSVGHRLCGRCAGRRCVHVLHAVHDSLILERLLIEVLHVRVVLELVCSLAHDVLYPRCEFGVAVADSHHEEHARSEHVVEVIGDERCDELVLLSGESHCFGVELACHGVHVASVHYGAVVRVQQFGLLVLQLVVLVEELEQLVVERSAANDLLSVVELDGDVATFYHERQYALVVHEDIGETHRVERSAELELAVYHVARVDLLEVVVAKHLQVEHASVERRHVRRSLNVVRAGARCQCYYTE